MIQAGVSELSMTCEIGAASDREHHLSVVIPIYNEEESIPPLLERLRGALKRLGLIYEIIAVDDGSRDNGAAVLKRYAAEIPELKIVRLRRNSGQTAAIMAGLERATGEVIITIDGDLQNDPDDIAKLVAKLNEGYDVVSGWRKNRQDKPFRRNFVSRIRVAEIEVKHHPRHFGRSKYGFARVVKVLLDLLVIVFLDRYFVKPIYLFGSIGLGLLGLSLLAFLWMIELRVFEGKSFIATPLPPLAAILGAVGIIALLLGLLAEIVMRTYFESQGRRAYLIRELVNFDRDE
jgi:glycosyltransferase involved in cell wall biosynthesis